MSQSAGIPSQFLDIERGTERRSSMEVCIDAIDAIPCFTTKCGKAKGVKAWKLCKSHMYMTPN